MKDRANGCAQADIPLDRDRFLRALLRELSGILEDSVGLNEAEGFIAMVGNRIGESLNDSYRQALAADRLTAEQVADALVDLKHRIKGGFSVQGIEADRIVLVNSRCPFGEYVEGRPSLCMMTSNVFGRVTADNLGYARVTLDQTLARGDSRCRVTIHLGEGDGGREYFA